MSLPRRHQVVPFDCPIMEAALLLQMVLLHRQMQCCLGHPKRSLLKDLMKQERLLKPTTLDILPEIPSVPLPPATSPGPPGEAYPLQSESSGAHTHHISKRCIPPPIQAGPVA